MQGKDNMTVAIRAPEFNITNSQNLQRSTVGSIHGYRLTSQCKNKKNDSLERYVVHILNQEEDYIERPWKQLLHSESRWGQMIKEEGWAEECMKKGQAVDMA